MKSTHAQGHASLQLRLHPGPDSYAAAHPALLLSIMKGDILQFFDKKSAQLTERAVLGVRQDLVPNKNGSTIVTIEGDVPGLALVRSSGCSAQ
jgi:hypothetical protein